MFSDFFTRRHRLIILILIVIILIFYISNLHKSVLLSTLWLFAKEDFLVYLPEIADREVEWIPSEKLIFFHETSLHILPKSVITLNARQACAVESAARSNPDSTVFLLYTVPSEFSEDPVYMNISIPLLNNLLKYQNIRIRKLDLMKYTRNTPLDNWYTTDRFKTSNYPIEHTSDVLRYLTLWKYGGTYMDLDFVVMNDLNATGSNYVVAESPGSMSNGILNFEHEGIGHRFANECVNEIRAHFRGDAWSYNGPELIQRVLKKICNPGTAATNMTKENCNGFRVHEPHLFYPVPWPSWKLFFDLMKVDQVLELAKSSFAIHVWNKLSRNEMVDTKKRVAYGVIAKQYCPYSYDNSGDLF